MSILILIALSSASHSSRRRPRRQLLATSSRATAGLAELRRHAIRPRSHHADQFDPRSRAA